ncbi:cingulin-like protein 1 isoform X2 [Anthonomus grandis grandis]|uniref:cingulin-like protein 1 isoform X2 n=1 Tax=Anthonomus grandis grandis TaxID=2921223 RepID=UPI0021657730|nr:cingulin-like protein 1 isoform X2 [Anthonomus grandis grandis]
MNQSESHQGFYDAFESENIPGEETVKLDNAEFRLAQGFTVSSPRSTQSGASSSAVFNISSSKKEPNTRQRPKSARSISQPASKVLSVRPTPVSSSIPLPVKTSGPIKNPSLVKNVKTTSRMPTPSKPVAPSNNKHTLEIQFLNKNKRYVQMKKDLQEKQKPIIELYQNLVQIKKRLEEFGKNVKVDEVKLITFDEMNKKPQNNLGGGEEISMEVVNGMKSSIEEIPKTLMDICKNLLSRRALIVELLESVTKSEVDVTQVSDKIESLKCEGLQLQQSLDGVIREHEAKITNLVQNWQKLLNDKKALNTDSKIEELELKLKEEEQLRENSVTVIQDLQRKMEEKKFSYDRSLAELNGVLHTLREQVKKLEQDLEIERKTTGDFKNRNSTHAQNLKTLRTRVTELESDKRDVEHTNAEMQKKIRLLQDQLKHKEMQWTKEKDEMAKNLKHQENLLQKLTADKNEFETRIGRVENAKEEIENELVTKISSLEEELNNKQIELEEVIKEKNAAVEKCTGFEKYISRMKEESKETMEKLSCSIEWGKNVREMSSPVAEKYMQDVAKDLRIRELEDKVRAMEKEKESYARKMAAMKEEAIPPAQMEIEIKKQKENIMNYQLMLEESERMLKEKSTEVQHLRSEIRQLKVRQESLEEQFEQCSTEEMKKMLDEGQAKLITISERCIQNEIKLDEYKRLIEKQNAQLADMDNLLRYRENMANVLKISRNDLLLEKESLSKYSREARYTVSEVTKQLKNKEAQLQAAQEKTAFLEAHVCKLEREIQELEENVRSANEKRFKLQETVGALEKELQRTHLKIKEMSQGEPRPSFPWRLLDSVCDSIVDDTPNKKVSHYSDNLTQSRQFVNNNNTSSILSSSNKLGTFIDDDSVSIHTNCHHKANSRSLIGLSLQTVDCIKTRLNFLSAIDMPLDEVSRDDTPQHKFVPQRQSLKNVSFEQSNSNENLRKVLELTAHRYEYLHNQAQESYEDLTKLVKMAVRQKRTSLDK